VEQLLGVGLKQKKIVFCSHPDHGYILANSPKYIHGRGVYKTQFSTQFCGGGTAARCRIKTKYTLYAYSFSLRYYLKKKKKNSYDI